MAPPVNKSGHPPDVTALIVTKVTDVNNVLRGSREMVAKNVPLASEEINARPVLLVTLATLAVSFAHNNLLLKNHNRNARLKKEIRIINTCYLTVSGNKKQ